MSEAIKLSAELKHEEGTGAARSVRRSGGIPAIVYGSKQQIMVSVEDKEFSQIFNSNNVYTKLFEINYAGKSLTAIIREVQLHPVKDKPIHIDFQQVSLSTEIKIAVRVKFINEDKAPGIKKGGVLNIVHRHVDCYCKAGNIVESITVDIGSLEIGRSIHINDIVLPEGMRPIDSSNFVLASISGRVEEVTQA